MRKVLRYLAGSLSVLLLTGCDESIVNAGYNTLLGMGMAFAVLIIISLVISLLSMFGRMQGGVEKPSDAEGALVLIFISLLLSLLSIFDRKEGGGKKPSDEEARLESMDKTIRQIEQNEARGSADEGELIAVMAAAIAAYEAEGGGEGGFRVRSIRRLNNWKRG